MTPLEVKKARDLAPTSGSLTVIAGPQGLGKSWFCGTMAEYLDPEEILVIATLPREINSVMYQKHNLDTVLVHDEQWNPSEGELVATGFDNLLEILVELRSDTKYKGIILDNGTEAAEQAWHASLEPLGVSDPTDLGKGSNSYAPYVSVREKMEELIRKLSILTGKTGLVKQPKLIAVPWHIQTPNEDEEEAKGVEYEGNYLPMIRGAFRRRLGTLVDAYVYANLVTIRKGNALSGDASDHYVIQVISDRERHCKLPGRLPDKSGLLKEKFLDVHQDEAGWVKLMEIMETLEPEE